MGSVYSEEEGSEDRYGSYSPSADVSESESDVDAASSSAAFSRLAAGSSATVTPTFTLPVVGGKDVVSWDTKTKRTSDLSEIDMMKARFAKLLLGEDMSGCGRGVCTALAISNAITNLSASIFGEIWRLEPMAAPKKAMWCREMDWLLSVCDSIVELVPSLHRLPEGEGSYEVMVTRPRPDLHMNLPALKKLDAMLISILDGFQDTEFWYVEQGIVMDNYDDKQQHSSSVISGRVSVQEEKWWLPCPRVPRKGLSEDSRKSLEQCKECTNQILKAAMAINSNVLAEMEIPDAYTDTLPKNGRDCLGDIIYRYITADQFSPEKLLDGLDFSSEHHTLDVANRIEAAVHVWNLKDRKKIPADKKSKRKAWGGKVKGLVSDSERNKFLANRAENLLQSLKLRFPGLSQTALDMSKIQYNKDVGHAILESYSRVMESLAFNIIARVDDVLYVDDAVKQCSGAEAIPIFNKGGGFDGMPVQKRMSPSSFSIQHSPNTSPFATPTFCSSPLFPSSPSTVSPIKADGFTAQMNHKVESLVKFWSVSGSIGSRRVSGDADRD